MFFQRVRGSIWGSVFGIKVAALLTLPVSAQVLEEVMVTAQKREQSLQDVGVSVTAFTGEQLARLGYKNSIEIAQQTPSMTVSSYHPTIANVNIRGVSQNDFADQLESPNALYVDDAYITNMGLASVQLFDLERVEVLRGPQGALFGRNATGGLLHYVSRRPTRAPEAYAELTGGEYGLIKGEGAISGPIGESIAGRLSFSAHYDDGYLENRLGEDVRDNGVWAVRAQLLFNIADQGEFLLKGYYSEDDTDGNAYTWGASVRNPSTWGPFGGSSPADGLVRFVPDNVNVYGTCAGCDLFGYRDADGDPHEESLGSAGFSDADSQGRGIKPFFEREVWGINGRLSYDIGGMTITSVTDYLTMDKSFREDSDGTPFFGALFATSTEVDQFSQEIRLNGRAGIASWIAGVYYLSFDTEQLADPIQTLTFGTPDNGIPIIPYSVTTSATIESRSWAVFGHVEWELSPQWTLITALRYTEDDREIKDHINFDTFGTLLPALGGPDISVSFNALFPNQAKQEWENVSAKVELDWRPTETLLLFGAFTRGHKAGNFALPLAAFIPAAFGDTSDLEAMPHDEEVLHSYEAGLKWDFADGRARLNGSIFYYDYHDYQASFFVSISQLIDNLDANVTGGELELSLRPMERLNLNFGISILDAEAENVTRTALLPPTDQALPYSPDYSFNGLARYEWPAFGGTLALQGDFNYVDDFCFTLVCHPVEEEDSYIVGNLRLSYTSGDEHWTVTGFVNNVGDAEYRQYSLELESVTTNVTSGFAPPRWFGATVRYDWF